MTVYNTEIAALLNRLADLLEIEGDNPFRIRAYRNAARLINELPRELNTMIHQGEDLTMLPGIGTALAEKITTLVKTGQLPQLETLEKRTPSALSILLTIEGLGPKRAKILHQKLHIKNLEDLKVAIAHGKVSTLKGFGEKTEKLILNGIQRINRSGQRITWMEAEKIALPLLAFLKKIPGVKKAEIAGSFRRRKETVGDLDILIVANQGVAIINAFVKYEGVAHIVSQGITRSTVHLHSGIQVDLRVVPQVSYGAALHYFTGSKSHNIALRHMAIKQHLKVNEYGIFKGTRRIAGKTETEFYKVFHLPYIEPELRENRGEIEAALKNKLPKLITLDDIRGDLHCHTTETDGQYSLEDMVKAAKKQGYDYLAITDHSKHLTVAHGLDKKRLLQQMKFIDKLNAQLTGIQILKGIEVDILDSGQLDLPNTI